MGKSKSPPLTTTSSPINTTPDSIPHLDWTHFQNLPSSHSDTVSTLSSSLSSSYNDGRFYTNIGSSVLVAIAPPCAANPSLLPNITSQHDSFFRLYKSINPLQPGSINALSIQPHIFSLANSLYFSLRRTGMDQCLILRGERGSSKTLQTFLVLEHLTHLACSSSNNSNSSSKRKDKFLSRINAFRTVLSGFGHASVNSSPDSSQFGGYYELQFSDRGKLNGIKFIPYLFQRNRVTSQPLGQRNYHSFYALLNGAPLDIRQEFGLTTPGLIFPYLSFGNPGPIPDGIIDDASRYSLLIDALKILGIDKRSSHYIFKLLAIILHLSLIQFQNDSFNSQESCSIKNLDKLQFIADLLEVDCQVLRSILTSRSTFVGQDLVTKLLTADQAIQQRDNLAKCLYHVLFSWIIEQANRKLSSNTDDDSSTNSFIALVDFPGFTSSRRQSHIPTGDNQSSNELLASQCLDEFVFKRLFVYGNEELRTEGMSVQDTRIPSTANVSKVALKQLKEDELPGDFISLIRGGNGNSGSRSGVFQSMFSEQTLNLDAYHRGAVTVLRSRTLLKRTPSLKRRPVAQSNTGLLEHTDHINNLLSSLDATQVRVAFCLSPNRSDKPSTAFDSKVVRQQLISLNIPEVLDHIRQRNGDFTVRYEINAFSDKYSTLLPLDQQSGAPRDKCNRIMHRFSLSSQEVYLGPSLVILRDDAWVFLETLLRKAEADRKKQNKAVRQSVNYGQFSDAGSVYSDYDGMTDDGYTDVDGDSIYAESINFPNERNKHMDATSKNRSFDNSPASDENKRKGDTTTTDEDSEEEVTPKTSSRRKWETLTWCLTWWIPTFCIRRCGKMDRPDIQMAWREKVAICILIFFVCALQLFFIIGFGRVICPRQNVLNNNELFFKKGAEQNSARLVGIYGAVYDLNDFDNTAYHSPILLDSFAGFDITSGFPRVPQHYCEYAAQNAPDFPPFGMDKPGNGSFIYNRHREFYERDVYLAERRMDYMLRQNVKALIGWDPILVKNMSTDARGENRNLFILGSRVYDIQPYINAAGNQRQFFPPEIVEYLRQNRGQDLSNDKTFLKWWLNDRKLRDCFNNLFLLGVVDYRKSTRCQLTNYILLAFSVLLAAVIGGKFLAAIQLGDAGIPENFDKFIIMQVPCYTEGEDSLRKCIDALASMRYDDKRKLLFLICDGMVMGSGNDRPTPRIVLDILGVDRSMDPEPLSFQSLGDGMKQHNMGKVYSGLYECMGHLVPYIVVVKVGKPSETVKPGNRGKRDSQMIMMRYLNKVMQDAPMSPLELELNHHIKNVIGVDPSFYEYCLMVDADTVVFQDSLTRLVAAMMHDTKIMGVCGETQLSNEKDTWATMIQVYEYYISHHLAKAFESLFGSVTCLPGCFSMYRIRTHNKSLPLLVSNSMIEDYGCTKVDTLHKKNLLHLGEDRYLTTLMLKHFPNMKTNFAQSAKCQTVAPDSWNVLLSQRRRWINSTIHNLVELLRIEQLCGFCCFSMRFVVMIDLIGTLVQPAIMGYLIYLIYMVVTSIMDNEPEGLPVLSIILLGIIYGLQALLFLLKREWQHIGWMIIYILAIPVFSFFIPVYSFWKNDDFSWGNTRIVMGEAGSKKVVLSGEEAQKFDISMIPHKSWSEYEREMMAPGDDDSQFGGATRHPSLLSESSMHDLKRSSSSRTLGTQLSSLGQQGSGNNNYNNRNSIVSLPANPRTNGSQLSPNNNSNNNNRNSVVSLPLSISPTSPLNFPTDIEIYHEVNRIVTSANLMSLTKKQVRDELSLYFNVDLTPRKDYINQCIAEILAETRQ